MDRKVKDMKGKNLEVKNLEVKNLEIKAWRSEEGERRWLSMLIGAMEQASRGEGRTKPCDPPVLARLKLQLARRGSSTPGADTSVLRD